jgi:diamine N-acetyltransferase
MYLQRHGESETNVEKQFTCRRLDPNLTYLGWQQVEQKIAIYQDADIQEIITSPSRRAVQSAEILGETLGLGVTVDDSLLEVDIGDLEGKSECDVDCLRVFFGTLSDWLGGASNARFPGGESGQDVADRIKRVMSLASPASLLVGHATFFAVLMGSTGMQFNKIEDLFLPHAGTARRREEQASWEILKIAEQSNVGEKNKMVIKGVITTLSPAIISDREKIFKWLTQSDVTSSMMGSPDYSDHPIPTWEEFKNDYREMFFNDSGNGKGRHFIIIAGETEVGTIGYDGMDRRKSIAELDIWIKENQYCGQGYGTDALNALTTCLFKEYEIENFIIRPSVRNKRAVRAYSKAGFTIMHLSREEQIRQFGQGDYADTVTLMKRMTTEQSTGERF